MHAVQDFFFRTCFIFATSYKVHITETVVCDILRLQCWLSCFVEDFNYGRICELEIFMKFAMKYMIKTYKDIGQFLGHEFPC